MNNAKVTRCFTRAMKNAKYLQKVAPYVLQKDTLPTDLFAKLHTIDPQSDEVKIHRELTQFFDKNRFPVVGRLPAGSLFSGTIYFVQVTFRTPNVNLSINNNDMRTIVDYATRAIIPISDYASAYGRNHISVSPNIIQYSVTLQGTSYDDQALQVWVNDIVNQNNLPSDSSCIFVASPQGLTVSLVGANGGYHGLANSPYIILGVFAQNLTLQDLQDAYAMGVSHEIAEMVVDPNVDHSNPEVCDPCDVNCHVLYRNFFDNNNEYISTTRNGLPPGFDYVYYISGIVRPNSATLCPAPDSACNYGPPVNRIILVELLDLVDPQEKLPDPVISMLKTVKGINEVLSENRDEALRQLSEIRNEVTNQFKSGKIIQKDFNIIDKAVSKYIDIVSKKG